MDDSKKEQLQKEFRTLINRNIQTVVRTALYGYFTSSKQAFKTKVTLQELVDYKLDQKGRKGENEKFQKFVTICDDIVIGVKLMFPCVNLEGMDLSWTTEEIQNHVWKMLDSTKEVTLEDCPRTPLEEQKKEKKKISAEQKALEKEVQKWMCTYFNVPPKTEFKRSRKLYEYVDLYVDPAAKTQARKNIDNTYNNTSRRHESQFIDDFKRAYPKCTNLYASKYSTFTDLMSYVKASYLKGDKS